MEAPSQTTLVFSAKPELSLRLAEVGGARAGRAWWRRLKTAAVGNSRGIELRRECACLTCLQGQRELYIEEGPRMFVEFRVGLPFLARIAMSSRLPSTRSMLSSSYCHTHSLKCTPPFPPPSFCLSCPLCKQQLASDPPSHNPHSSNRSSKPHLEEAIFVIKTNRSQTSHRSPRKALLSNAFL